MATKPPRPWTVTPHGPLEHHDDNLWSVQSPVPGLPGKFPRRMTVVRLDDGRLLFHNAIPVDEPTLDQIRSLGTPSLLFLPSPFHCIDGHAMKAKLGLRVVSPAESKGGVGARVEVDHTADALDAPGVKFHKLGGTNVGETVLAVTSGGARVTLLVCDSIFNIPHRSGLNGLAFKLFGFSGPPHSGPIWKRKCVTDRAALKRSFEELAATPNLARLLPSHGDVINGGIPDVLRSVAAQYS